MKKKSFTSSCDWIAWFYENAQRIAMAPRPPHNPGLPSEIRAVIAASLPAWQLGESSEGRHLRAAARQYARRHDDPAFCSAVELFIREEQRHGARLGEWLDLAGIPRRNREFSDSIFRCCRHLVANYAACASVLIVPESLAEIYYAAIRRLVPCPRLQAECSQILRDEVRHVRFQCEYLAFARRHIPGPIRPVLWLVEAFFFAATSAVVWIGHGRLLRASGMSLVAFAREAARKFRFAQRLMHPSGYDFETANNNAPQLRRLRLPYASMMR
jgi:hypothetical protein